MKDFKSFINKLPPELIEKARLELAVDCQCAENSILFKCSYNICLCEQHAKYILYLGISSVEQRETSVKSGLCK